MEGAGLQRMKLVPGNCSLRPAADKRRKSPRGGFLLGGARDKVLTVSDSDGLRQQSSV
jgi:hypothetical protein